MIILFSRPKGFSFFGSLVRLWQGHTKYSHVAIQIQVGSQEMVFESSYGRVHVSTRKKWNEHNHETHRLVMPLMKQSNDEVLARCINYINKPYGFLTLIGIIIYKVLRLKLFKDGNKSFTCSEFVATVLFGYVKGLDGLMKDVDYIEPIHLFKLLGLKD